MHSSWRPFLYASLLASGLLIGFLLSGLVQAPVIGRISSGRSLFGSIQYLVEKEYVDKVAYDSLEKIAITDYLEKLDPFSVYIPPDEVKAANEPLEGNFEGIGIEFNLFRDTVMITSVIPGGPSDKSGIMAGDRIIRVNEKDFAGTSLNNEKVFKTLRGEKGSSVKLDILRRGQANILPFEIKRGQIPIHSVEVAFMLNGNTGYIKIIRFAQNTLQEFRNGLQDLKKKGMTDLIIDLRGNPGGLLPTATDLADEFLPEGKLIVYTEGKNQPRDEIWSTPGGSYESGKLIVLLDDHSASASEVLSGALQDHDRATIIGQRSFGKGLVQRGIPLSNGGELRLTIARYYTPSGRSIQKPYSLLREQQADSILDKDAYKTDNGRKVYGGGGIKPDIELASDTSHLNDLLNALFSSGVYQEFVYQQIPDELKKNHVNFQDASAMTREFDPERLNWSGQFKTLAVSRGIRADENTWKATLPFLIKQFKAAAGKQLFREEGYYRSLLVGDKVLETALQQD